MKFISIAILSVLTQGAFATVSVTLPKQDIKYRNGVVLKLKDLQLEAAKFTTAKENELLVQDKRFKLTGVRVQNLANTLSPSVGGLFKKYGINTQDFESKYFALRKTIKPEDPNLTKKIQPLWEPFNLQIKQAFTAAGWAPNTVRGQILQNIDFPQLAVQEPASDTGPMTISWIPGIIPRILHPFPISQNFHAYGYDSSGFRDGFNFSFTGGDRGQSLDGGRIAAGETCNFAGVDEHSFAGQGLSVPVPAGLHQVRATANLVNIEASAQAMAIFAAYASATIRATLEVDEGDQVICTQELPMAGAMAVAWGDENVRNGLSADDPEFPAPWNQTLQCEGTRTAGGTGVLNAYVRIDVFAGTGGGMADAFGQLRIDDILLRVSNFP